MVNNLLEDIYNQKRLHSDPGHEPLGEFEEFLLGQPNKVLPRQTLLTLTVPT
jgi:hypothetical protein